MNSEIERRPTEQMYAELQAAYDHFNAELFNNELPACIITLQRQKKTLGYFSPNRFTNLKGSLTDEIAMNPSYFALQGIQEAMQTLVHEMCHLWQHHFGTRGRGRYHNEEWARKMKEVGLIPSATGKPGGKQTGDSMSDYVFEGGAFEQSFNRLITKKYVLSWLDRFPPTLKSYAETLHQLPEEVRFAMNEEDLQQLGIQVAPEPVKKKGTLTYKCPLCAIKTWGKPGLRLGCITCQVELTEEDK